MAEKKQKMKEQQMIADKVAPLPANYGKLVVLRPKGGSKVVQIDDKETAVFLEKNDDLAFKVTGVKDRILQKMLVKNECDLESTRKLLFQQNRDRKVDVSLIHNKAVFLAILEQDFHKSDQLFSELHSTQGCQLLQPGWQLN